MKWFLCLCWKVDIAHNALQLLLTFSTANVQRLNKIQKGGTLLLKNFSKKIIKPSMAPPSGF